jgi:hypothetical protein
MSCGEEFEAMPSLINTKRIFEVFRHFHTALEKSLQKSISINKEISNVQSLGFHSLFPEARSTSGLKR